MNTIPSNARKLVGILLMFFFNAIMDANTMQLDATLKDTLERICPEIRSQN